MRIKCHCNLMLLSSVANQEVFASLSPQHSYPHSNIHTSILSQITRIRGGEGEGSSTPPPETTYNQYSAQNQQPQMANPNFQQPPTNDPMYGYRETVEDRIDAWRKQQLVSTMCCCSVVRIFCSHVMLKNKSTKSTILFVHIIHHVSNNFIRICNKHNQQQKQHQ